MGSALSAAAAGRRGGGGGGQDAAEPSSAPAGPPLDDVTCVLPSGRSLAVGGLRGTDPAARLVQQAAEELGVPWFTLKLCLGSQVLAPLDRSLQDLGLSGGEALTAVVRPPRVIESPGESRYNSQYRCTVSRVEEVEHCTWAVSFEVVGDMSLGRLQDPKASVLSASAPSGRQVWSQNRGAASPIRPEPAACTFEEEDRERRIRGTLIFAGVPQEWGEAFFTFGQGGYSPLRIPLSEEEG